MTVQETITPPRALYAEQLRRARAWAWEQHDRRSPGAARDLLWALICLARDHDPDIYGQWETPPDDEVLASALDLVRAISRLVKQADTLQPHLVRGKSDGRPA